ncbi:conserved Plasmodium protein, unknown function [Plasmodium vivax]|uniref:Uncharacterized protein n=6 Tax=Plasmodium vivax TaxID=5855 RepID=A5K1H7_PLAVS|nr:hypothetical protein, conserved [Plasmodium vivax]KMZ78152.1 hypothetical protein PVIIG_04926 [Plasmodium vivax India VII]KMZ83971.1 hypothetical protein PVBG_01050 [Plasmodium vivax Brazil I]KMZ90807.1 hypothetical protein PVMG_02975 [Plasmodium vivax Mauritania I]KMZ97281.1 hypothetical protein PVNG_05077 [Plasmodium vivax North Korean]EDL47174.1 hypothetical protein, conserved [Plasmodium vivax]|eukprot:XP_001616901.1 hypothetical protein [Plasmodium vivax Sal-1]
MKVLFYASLSLFGLALVSAKGEKKNIMNSIKNDGKNDGKNKAKSQNAGANANMQDMLHYNEIEKIKELISQNKLEEANALFNEMKKTYNSNEKDGKGKNYMGSNNYAANKEENKFAQDMMMMNNNQDFFNNLINPNDLQEMIKFYMYLQNLLSSKNETSEKKMVKTFLRKTIQKMKDNEKNEEKKSIDNIIKDTEGHTQMLEKLADLMKINKEKLQDEEVKNKLNQILIGMMKFIDYTNNSDIAKALMDEIKIKEVKNADGASKPKLQVNIGNSKAHLEMLQKATNFMGMDIDPEELKNLTINNKWYETFLNNLLNSSDEL